jgi:tetratricopeptide (TPR) repeat protein
MKTCSTRRVLSALGLCASLLLPQAPQALAATPTPASQGESAPAQDSGDVLERAKQELTLEQQKKQFLFERHVANARSMLTSLRLEDAEREINAALELDATNLEAKQLAAEIQGLLGRRGALDQVGGKSQIEEFQVRLQQLRTEAGESLQKAKLHLERGEYDPAVAELTIAQNYVRWAPAGVDWGGMEKEITDLLARAKQEREAATRAKQEQKEKETMAELRSQEERERARSQAQVANMLQQSIAAFATGDFDQSIAFADRALRIDPRNEKAVEVRDAAFRAGREQVRADYVQKKREEFQRWNAELDALRVPWTHIVSLPDEEFWRDISSKRGARGFGSLQKDSPAEAELKERLRTTRIPGLKVESADSLGAVIDYVRTATGFPLVVDPAAEAAASNAGASFSFNLTNALAVEDALNIITQPAGEEVTWTVRHDAVLITTKAKARGRPVIVSHDVQDLVFGLTDFLGPRIDRIRLLDELTDDDNGGPFGAIGEKPKLIEIGDLKTLITDNIAPGTWEEEGISIAEGEGNILVVHTPQVQEQVRQFLNDLRRFSSSLVTIESRFMTVSSNWIQEIGVDFRGLDNPNFPFKDLDDVTNGLEDNASKGLDNGGLGAASGNPSSGFFYDDGGDGAFLGRTENFFGDALGKTLSNIGGLTAQLTFLNDAEVSAILRMIEKSSDFQLINSQVISVHNTQRAYVSVINQKAYIQDFDVEVAQFMAVADPTVNVLIEGVVLDVRPTIHHDRKYLTLEIQPTVAKVVALNTFSSTLGGNTSPVEFQLPELEVQSVFTTALLPDGGSLLLGGLSDVRNVERRAEVPWLAKVPLAGFLFKQEGYSDERKSLMILLRATITDVNDRIAQQQRTAAR